jgi:hypothetical protein
MDVAVGHLHLAGVQAGANLEAQVLRRVANRARAVDRSRRAGEHRKRVGAGELHDDTTPARTCRSTRRLWSARAAVHARTVAATAVVSSQAQHVSVTIV